VPAVHTSTPIDPPIPVTLLTGFLGSGKTTLLNALVRSPLFARTLVIINEFGEVGLDHLLFTHTPDNVAEDIVVEMSSGCLCCTIRGDLRKTLKDLPWRFARDGKRRFDRVVIETTGLADPAPILHTLMADEAVAHRYRLDGVLATVDAANAAQTLSRQFEAVKQVAVADRLLLTKTDLVDEQTRSAVRRRLARINPAAAIIEVVAGQIDADALSGLSLYSTQGKPADVLRWLNAEAALSNEHEHDHTHDVNRHDERIRAWSFVLDEPLDPALFEAWWETMKDLAGADLLRMKGLVHIAGQAAPTVVHAVQHLLHPPVTLARWPSDDKRSRLVFITRDLQRKTLEDSFAAFGLR